MSAFSSEKTDLFEKPIFRIEKLINALKTYSETFKIEFTGWLRTMYQKAGREDLEELISYQNVVAKINSLWQQRATLISVDKSISLT